MYLKKCIIQNNDYLLINNILKYDVHNNNNQNSTVLLYYIKCTYVCMILHSKYI